MSKKKTTKKVVTTTTTTIEESNENNKTQIVCVLDASGSMSSMIDEARQSLNKFLNDQKELEGDAIVSIVTFSSGHDSNNGYELIRDSISIQDMDEITSEDWYPSNMTALNDAIGKGINDTVYSNKKMKKSERPNKTLFVIVTDGHENSSREYNASQIKNLITTQEKNDWQFIYLAANQDAFAVGNNYGISKGNTMNFMANSAGSSAVYDTLNVATANYRTNRLSKTRGAVFSSVVDNTKTLGDDDL